MSTLKIWESVQAADGAPLIRLDSRITANSVTFTGTAGQSAAFDDDTGIISVLADADCAVAIGSDPTATTGGFPVPAGVRVDFRVTAGQKISAIANPGASGLGRVAVQGFPGTLADKSGTITTGGTAQAQIAANANRNGFLIQNQSTGDLYFSTLATAIVGQPSIKIEPGQMYETPVNGFGTGAVSIIGATTGQAFAAREW